MSRKPVSFESFLEWWNFVAGGDPTDGSSVDWWLHQRCFVGDGARTTLLPVLASCSHLGVPRPRSTSDNLMKFVRGDLHWDLTASLSLQFGFPTWSILCRILWLVGCMFLPSYRHLLASMSTFFLFFDWFDFYIHCEIKPQKIPHSFYNIFIS